jgi:hypothetical protein
MKLIRIGSPSGPGTAFLNPTHVITVGAALGFFGGKKVEITMRTAIDTHKLVLKSPEEANAFLKEYFGVTHEFFQI